MQRRICNVLIVANPYDAFMLEDDGRVDEKIFAEYARLGLRFPPRFIKASSLDEAEQRIETNDIDLVIVMPSRTADAQEEDVFEIAKTIKLEHNNIPIVVLTPFSHGITARMQDIDLSLFEYVFCWLGNTELLCTSTKSRNFSFGQVVATNNKRQIAEYLNSNTVEGYYTLKSIYKLVKKKRIKMPIIDLIYDIVMNGKNPNKLGEFLINKK